MARATRSITQQQEKEKEKLSSDIAPSAHTLKPKPATTKKRKRNSVPDNDVQPATKQLRIDLTIKDEDSQEPEGMLTKLPHLQEAGDVPIDSVNAQKILEILEMIDNQGLLDRVFPLRAESLTLTSEQQSLQSSYSFRNLLKESSQHPLCVLRSAVRHLLPISSQPRSRPSVPAAQQLRFCNLALFLLDQASFHSVPIPLDLETLILPHSDPLDTIDDSKTSHSFTSDISSAPRMRKYALVQRLPTGDWWTSLNSDFAAESRKLQDLTTAHAELVAILPSITTSKCDLSLSVEKPRSSTITLGSYSSKKATGPKPKLPAPRSVGCGSFLDYGEYASFAPTFDQVGVEVGRQTLGEVIWGKREWKRMKANEPSTVLDEVVRIDRDDTDRSVQEVEGNGLVGEVGLDGLLPPEEVAMIKSALGSLELENAVHELLERNGRALERLEELQGFRWSGEGGGSSEVRVGSEEWDTAQGIMDSLTVLASLRPRSSDGSDTLPLIPPASVLHKLHRTLPVGACAGWYGTLPGSRSTALRDDTTVRVRAGATIHSVISAAPAVGSTVSAAGATTAATVYPGFPYPNYGGQQYRGGGYTYKPGQGAPYYPATYGVPTQGQVGGQGQGQGQTGGTGYYPNQGYGGAGQQAYAYSSWYNYQAPATAGTSSGRGTPQPGTNVSGASGMATNYAGFFNAQTTGAGQRAVANTVVSSKGGGYGQGTIAVHLRNTSGYQQQSYGTYQQASSTTGAK